MHAWELGNASFDYFFFKENCSYHLLALLDYADPTLHLTDEFLLDRSAGHSPAHCIETWTGLRHRLSALPQQCDPSEARILAIAENGRSLIGSQQDLGELTSPAFVSIGVYAASAFLLDLASDYLRYRIDTTDEPPPELKERNRAVLTARSQLQNSVSRSSRWCPLRNNRSWGTRLPRQVGAGWRNDDTFEEVHGAGRLITICSIRRSGIRRMRRLSWPRSACVTTTASIRRGLSGRHFANVLSLSPIDSVVSRTFVED